MQTLVYPRSQAVWTYCPKSGETFRPISKTLGTISKTLTPILSPIKLFITILAHIFLLTGKRPHLSFHFQVQKPPLLRSKSAQRIPWQSRKGKAQKMSLKICDNDSFSALQATYLSPHLIKTTSTYSSHTKKNCRVTDQSHPKYWN